jgi:SAM-dependent methyltransferase
VEVNQLSRVAGGIHSRLVLNRRVSVLAGHLAEFLPANARVLDIGCGDGMIDRLMLAERPDATIEGIDVLVQPETQIPVQAFDGSTIPCGDHSFDVALFVDVLHHTKDPLALLTEAVRVSPRIVIKDHFRDGLFAGMALRFMDWVGNAHRGVALPYNYWTRRQWLEAFDMLGLHLETLRESLGLYPVPASWLFERGLHFIACLGRGPARAKS